MKERRYYHYIFSTYKRGFIFNSESKEHLTKYFYETAKEKLFKIIKSSIQDDHTHLLIEQKQNDRPSYIMKCIKGSSSYKYFKRFPNINRLTYRKLWGRSFYCREVREENLDIVINYIKNQTNILGEDKRFV